MYFNIEKIKSFFSGFSNGNVFVCKLRHLPTTSEVLKDKFIIDNMQVDNNNSIVIFFHGIEFYNFVHQGVLYCYIRNFYTIDDYYWDLISKVTYNRDFSECVLELLKSIVDYLHTLRLEEAYNAFNK